VSKAVAGNQTLGNEYSKYDQ